MDNPFRNKHDNRTSVQGFKAVLPDKAKSQRPKDSRATTDFYQEKFKMNKRNNEIVAQVMAHHDSVKKQQAEKDKRDGQSKTISRYQPDLFQTQTKRYRIRTDLYKSKPVPVHIRKDPFAEIPVIKLDDLNKGLYTLVNQGYLGKQIDITQALQRNSPLFNIEKLDATKVLYNDSILELNVTDKRLFSTDPISKPGSGNISEVTYASAPNANKNNSRIFKTEAFGGSLPLSSDTQPLITAPMLEISSTVQRSFQKAKSTSLRDGKSIANKQADNYIKAINQKFIEVINGVVKKDENYLKQRSLNLMQWGDIEEIIDKVVSFAVGENVMSFRMHLDRLKELSTLMRSPTLVEIISCIEKYKKIKDFVASCYTRTEKNFDDVKSRVAVRIQKNFRKLLAKRMMSQLATIQKKIKLIQFHIRLKHIHQETVKRTAQINAERYKTFMDLNKKFIEDWDSISTQRRVEVHINSLSSN